MIKMLQNRVEIKEADKFLDRLALSKHGHIPQKNWDVYQLYAIAKSMPSEIKIIDLG